jgi:hypothetical protein
VHRFLSHAALAVSIVAGVAQGQQESEKVYKVSGWGAHPISADLTSMWLVAPGGQPLVMVYFHGPEGWHKAEWKLSSKFEKGMPGWAQLTSEKATLRIWLDPDTGQAEVQAERVNVHEANTYLVLRAGDAKGQKVIPLGRFDFPKSGDDPASVLLLREKPDLLQKIQKAVADEAGV